MCGAGAGALRIAGGAVYVGRAGSRGDTGIASIRLPGRNTGRPGALLPVIGRGKAPDNGTPTCTPGSCAGRLPPCSKPEAGIAAIG